MTDRLHASIDATGRRRRTRISIQPRGSDSGGSSGRRFKMTSIVRFTIFELTRRMNVVRHRTSIDHPIHLHDGTSPVNVEVANVRWQRCTIMEARRMRREVVQLRRQRMTSIDAVHRPVDGMLAVPAGWGDGGSGSGSGVLALVLQLMHCRRRLWSGTAAVGQKSPVPPRAVPAVRVEIVRVDWAAGLNVETGGLERAKLVETARTLDEKQLRDVIREIWRRTKQILFQ